MNNFEMGIGSSLSCLEILTNNWYDVVRSPIAKYYQINQVLNSVLVGGGDRKTTHAEISVTFLKTSIIFQERKNFLHSKKNSGIN